MSAFILSDKHFSAIAFAVLPDNAQQLANKLKAINIASVNYRYDEKTRVTRVKLDVQAKGYNPAIVCKLIDCWDYQSCEESFNLDFVLMDNYLEAFKNRLSKSPDYDKNLAVGIWSI